LICGAENFDFSLHSDFRGGGGGVVAGKEKTGAGGEMKCEITDTMYDDCQSTRAKNKRKGRPAEGRRHDEELIFLRKKKGAAFRSSALEV
jgi:hypothetical protein